MAKIKNKEYDRDEFSSVLDRIAKNSPMEWRMANTLLLNSVDIERDARVIIKLACMGLNISVIKAVINAILDE